MGEGTVADTLILTTAGLAKLAVASPESPLEIAHLAVGDGAGGYPPLSPSMTALANEVWRGTASAPIREPSSPTVLKFETVIPADEGGFFIRELGLFDSDDALIAIAQCSVVEKPSALSSTALTMTVSMRLTLANAAQTQVVVSDQPFLDHGGLSGRNVPDSHPMAAITGLTGRQSFNATEALSLPSTIAGAVSLKSTAYNMRAILPKAADLARAVEVTLYLSHDSTHPVMVRAATGDTLNMPDDVKYHSVPGELILRPTGGWVSLRSIAGGWELVASNTHQRDPSEIERGLPYLAADYEVEEETDPEELVRTKMLSPYTAIKLMRSDVSKATESLRGTILIGTQAQVNAGADDVVVTPETLKNGGFWPLGMGQSFVDVTSLRAIGTTYTNTSGRPILVAVTIAAGSSASRLVFNVNGVSVIESSASVSAAASGVTMLVPRGGTYSVTYSGAAPSIYKWIEIK